MDVSAVKGELRAELRARRAALSPGDAEAAAHAVRRRARDLLATRPPGPVLAYAAVRAELDLGPLLAELAEARVLVLPAVEGSELRLRRVVDPADLVPGWRGVPEPPPGSAEVGPSDLDVALVPGLGFDAAGGRLGSGGGHFDRLLARCRPSTLVVGVAFSVQLVPEIPREAHDRPVDVVLTELGVHGAAAG